MKIQVEIPEEQFKELLEKELKDLPKEQIQQILLESIRSYVDGDTIVKLEDIRQNNYGDTEYNVSTTRKSHDKLNALLTEKQSGGYFSSGGYVSPSPLFKDILKQCDFSGLQDIVDDMIKDLRENHHNILIEVMSRRIVDSFTNDHKFQSELTDVIQVQLNARNSQ